MAKLAVSATLVFVFLRGLDLDAAAAALSRIAYAPLIAALVVLAAIIALLGARWHLILQALGIALSPARTLAMTYIGAFFNQVLPTSMGGDVVRVWHTTRAGFGWKRAAASAVLERLAGAAGLVPLGGLGLWLLWDRLTEPGLRGAIIVLALAVVAAIAALASVDRLPRRLRRLPGMETAASFSPHVRAIFLDRRLAPFLIVTSIAGHLMASAAFYALAEALSLPVSPLQSVAITPIAILVTLIPLSFAGWGLREGAMIVLLRAISIDFDDAVVLSILFGVSLFVSSLPGLVLWIFFRPRRADPAPV